MNDFHSSICPAAGAAARYGMAILFVVVTAWLSQPIAAAYPGDPSAFYYAAVALSAWRCGIGPGLSAGVLASMAVATHLPPPSFIAHDRYGFVVRLAVTFLAAWVISSVCSKQRRAQLDLMKARDELEQRVRQRIRDLEVCETRLKQIQRTGGIGLWEHDLMADRISWPEETGRIFCLPSPAGGLGRSDLRKLIHPDDWQRTRKVLEAPHRHGHCGDLELRIVGPDSEARFVRFRPEVLCDATGRPVRAIGTMQDITRLRETEEKLRQTETELARVARVTTMGELAASIAHELNQPLAAVVTNGHAASRWLAAWPPNLEETGNAIQRIVREGSRASEIIRRIRESIKKQHPARTPFDLNELVRETLTLTKPELERERVECKPDLTPDLPAVAADRVQMQQVLLNLIGNAVDSLNAVAERPRVLCIRTHSPERGLVQVAVQDNGLGIGSQSDKDLFEPFFTTKADGLGMGLAISRSIVERHGGRLWATSNDWNGATFQFTLPVQHGGES